MGAGSSLLAGLGICEWIHRELLIRLKRSVIDICRGRVSTHIVGFFCHCVGWVIAAMRSFEFTEVCGFRLEEDEKVIKTGSIWSS